MMPLLPGDQLWNRYRVERVANAVLEGAWLSPLHRGMTPDDARTRFLLVPLSPVSAHPLSALLDVLQSASTVSREKGDETTPHKQWPLIGQVDFIGGAEDGGSAVVTAPASITLATLISRTGPLMPAQVLPIMIDLAGSVHELLKAGSGPDENESRAKKLPLLLARLLNPDALSVTTTNSRFMFQVELAESARLTNLPAWAEFLPPEVFIDEPVTAAACVFSLAQIAAYCLGHSDGRMPFNKLSMERAYAALAEWIAGKHDPAHDFLAGTAAAALHEDFKELIARCLSRKASKRIATPARFVTALEKLEREPWAQSVNCCEYCGFVMGTAAECPCCGKPAMVHGADVLSGAAGKSGQHRKAVKGGTALKTKSQPDVVNAVLMQVPAGMVLIPGGTFLSGERKVPRALRHFAIDTLPVTEKEYKEYLAATEKSPREEGPGSRPDTSDSLPVTGITWHEASDYASHVGKRLPTVFEWEKAARGVDGRKFPYGNTFKPECGRLRVPEDTTHEQGPAAVGSYPDGMSPYGVLDMAGNVLEWTSSARRAGARLFRAVKGACFKDGSADLTRCTSIQYLPAECSDPTLGFRCVKDVD